MNRNLIPFLLCLAACQTGGGTETPPPTPDLAVLYRSQLTVDAGSLQKGEWVRYAIWTDAKAPLQSVTFSVVDKSEEGVWIENRVPGRGAVGTWIIKSQYSLAGDLLQQWIGQPGDPAPRPRGAAYTLAPGGGTSIAASTVSVPLAATTVASVE